MSKTDKLRNALKRMEHGKVNGIMSSRDTQKKKKSDGFVEVFSLPSGHYCWPPH